MEAVNHYSETDLGNVSPNPRGEYDPKEAYEYLDLVSYQGGSYLCLTELGTTIIGTAPEPGHNTEFWQMLTLPGGLTSEYVAMHDNVVNKAAQVEISRAAVEQAQQEVEAAQADVQQLHEDTVQAAQEAENSRDSAAGYAQSAEASRRAAAESEQNINAQVTGFETKVSESVTQAQEEIATTRQQAIWAVASQQAASTQAVKDQTASYITEKETSAKTEIKNYTSEKVTEINNKASEANITLANTIADGTSLKTQLETTISTADTSKKNLDASDAAAGKTKTALDASNTTATKTKADLDASNATASEAKTGLDATNKTAADLVVSLGDKITEGTRVKTDIQTTGETAMSNLQAEAAKQQEYIKTSIDNTLSISGKAADAAVTGKKIDSLKEDIVDFKDLADFTDSNDDSKDTLYIADVNGKIIATVSKEGIDAVGYKKCGEDFVSGSVDLLETYDDVFYIADGNGNVIFKASKNGVEGVNISASSPSPYKDKVLISIGDSLSAHDKWQKWLVEWLGVLFDIDTNINGKDGHAPMAKGGTAIIPNSMDSIYIRALSASHYNPDIIILYAGQNDVPHFGSDTEVNSSAVGTIDDVPYKKTVPYTELKKSEYSDYTSWYEGRPTLYSCCMGLVENLLTSCPKAQIIVVTPMQMWTSDGTQSVGRKQLVTTWHDICNKYALPIVDLWNKSGVSAFNMSEYYPNVGNVHPNDYGYKRIAETIYSEM